MTPPDIYFFLGAAGSGRREILYDLFSEGFAEGEQVAFWHSAGESPAEVDANIQELPNVQCQRYQRLPDLPAPEPECGAWVILSDGLENPVDQVEALKLWLDQNKLEVTRLITVLNCALLHSHDKLKGWYQACIHFSDVVLLNRRENLPNQWISDFRAEYKKACFPCLFEWVKHGRVENPARILYPETRRVSHAFDDLEATDTLELDEENLPQEGFDLKRSEDPYFERHPGGLRKKPIPEIREFL